MQFYVNAGDGTSGRKARTIRFVGERAMTVTCPQLGGFELRDADGVLTETTSVTEAAGIVAGLLHRLQDHSVVIEAGPGTVLRGDEEKTADVYPPHRHPRINVEG